MRRLVLIFMMCLLPLQWSWAAAASVCAHEGETATHFGHHEHQHGGEAKSDHGEQQPSDSKSGGYHPDCHSCHAMGAVCLAHASDSQPAWAATQHRSDYSRYFPEPPVESFLRPPLNLVA